MTPNRSDNRQITSLLKLHSQLLAGIYSERNQRAMDLCQVHKWAIKTSPEVFSDQVYAVSSFSRHRYSMHGERQTVTTAMEPRNKPHFQPSTNLQTPETAVKVVSTTKSVKQTHKIEQRNRCGTAHINTGQTTKTVVVILSTARGRC